MSHHSHSRLHRIIHAGHTPLGTLLILTAATVFGALFPVLAAKLHAPVHIYEELLAMAVIPFIISAIIVSLRRLSHGTGAYWLSIKLFLLILALITGMAAIGLATGMVAQTGIGLPEESLATFSRLVQDKAAGDALEAVIDLHAPPPAATLESSIGHVVRYILPANVFEALSHGEHLKIIVFCVIIGLAIGRVHPAADDYLTRFLHGVYLTTSTLVRGISFFVPIIAFCSVATAVSHFGIGSVLAMIRFIVWMVFGSLLLSLIFAAYSARTLGIRLGDFLLGIKDAALQAVAAQSFTAAVPNTISALVADLKISPKAANLLIPLYATLMRVGPAFYFGLAICFIAQLYGVHLTPKLVLLMLLGTIISAISSAGSTGSVTVSYGALACALVGLPFEAAFIFLVAADEICVLPRALLNLTGSVAATSLLSRSPELAHALEAESAGAERPARAPKALRPAA